MSYWQKFEGTKFNEKYRLKKLLGEGAFGGVFSADEIIDDEVLRTVAIKIPNPSQNVSTADLIKEIRVAITLKNPYIIECFAWEQGTLEQQPTKGLIMELGTESLESRMSRGKLLATEVRAVILAVASALVYLRNQKIVHRDIKPANILYVRGIWKVADVGIARILENDGTTKTQSGLGTPLYFPPEGYDGTISPAFDLWSLGILIFVMNMNSHPFRFVTKNELMHQVIYEKPNLSGLPSEFKEIVEGCLQKDYKKNRWTADDVIEALEPQPKRVVSEFTIPFKLVGTSRKRKSSKFFSWLKPKFFSILIILIFNLVLITGLNLTLELTSNLLIYSRVSSSFEASQLANTNFKDKFKRDLSFTDMLGLYEDGSVYKKLQESALNIATDNFKKDLQKSSSKWYPILWLGISILTATSLTIITFSAYDDFVESYSKINSEILYGSLTFLMILFPLAVFNNRELVLDLILGYISQIGICGLLGILTVASISLIKSLINYTLGSFLNLTWKYYDYVMFNKIENEKILISKDRFIYICITSLVILASLFFEAYRISGFFDIIFIVPSLITTIIFLFVYWKNVTIASD